MASLIDSRGLFWALINKGRSVGAGIFAMGACLWGWLVAPVSILGFTGLWAIAGWMLVGAAIGALGGFIAFNIAIHGHVDAANMRMAGIEAKAAAYDSYIEPTRHLMVRQAAQLSLKKLEAEFLANNTFTPEKAQGFQNTFRWLESALILFEAYTTEERKVLKGAAAVVFTFCTQYLVNQYFAADRLKALAEYVADLSESAHLVDQTGAGQMEVATQIHNLFTQAYLTQAEVTQIKDTRSAAQAEAAQRQPASQAHVPAGLPAAVLPLANAEREPSKPPTSTVSATPRPTASV